VYISSGSLFTSKKRIPQLTFERSSIALSFSPIIYNAAASASTDERTQGLPKLTGLAAIKKGSARRILQDRTFPISNTNHEQSKTVIDFTYLSAGESACSAVGSRSNVFRGIWEILLNIFKKPAFSSFFTVHFLGSQLLSRYAYSGIIDHLCVHTLYQCTCSAVPVLSIRRACKGYHETVRSRAVRAHNRTVQKIQYRNDPAALSGD